MVKNIWNRRRQTEVVQVGNTCIEFFKCRVEPAFSRLFHSISNESAHIPLLIIRQATETSTLADFPRDRW
ncbi:MAG: hypothetical protein BWY82_02691 [Verrucomicrobia bacterium ADurb.Bin474]|nr:MAG: hypothetical protein BWY82_02691 [Verrucomicrobia bacterium ADurb.Bin474]